MKEERGIDYFSALYDVARAINASLDPSQVLGEIVKSVVSALKLKAATIRLLDSRRSRLVLGAAFGLSDKYLHKGPVLIKESGIDRNVLAGRSIWIRDAQEGENFQYPEMAKAEGIRSVQAMPLSVENKVIGVLRVYSATLREFTGREISFLEAAANLSAIALDNAMMHQKLQTNCDLMAANKYRIDDN